MERRNGEAIIIQEKEKIGNIMNVTLSLEIEDLDALGFFENTPSCKMENATDVKMSLTDGWDKYFDGLVCINDNMEVKEALKEVINTAARKLSKRIMEVWLL